MKKGKSSRRPVPVMGPRGGPSKNPKPFRGSTGESGRVKPKGCDKTRYSR